jgi:hypothetical protein
MMLVRYLSDLRLEVGFFMSPLKLFAIQMYSSRVLLTSRAIHATIVCFCSPPESRRRPANRKYAAANAQPVCFQAGSERRRG